MARTSAQDWMCVLGIWVMVLMCSSAERQYFRQNTNATWNEARSHCQSCFKELVTITPENVQIIAQDLSSDYWIGLRKTLNSTINAPTNSVISNNTTVFWSRWANGDPLTFQNWYLGHPVFKSSFPRRHCCSCSCTCPAPVSPGLITTATQEVTGHIENVTNFTKLNNFTQTTRPVQNTTIQNTQTNKWSTSFTTAAPFMHTPVQSQCVKSPVIFQDVPDPDENYIEDPCVAVLSFGAWVEKDCWERRPFICYEDRFYGHVNVTDITSTSANLTWDSGPGAITHYRVEIKGPNESLLNWTELTYHLHNLTPGALYSVQVFPVKCGRDLNPENATFYTVPNKVSDLRVINQTENCVSLGWSKPAGNVDLYIINIDRSTKRTETKTEGKTVCDLIPGSLYTFSVRSGVNDKTKWSDESTVSTFTKPEKVSNLHPSNISDTSLLLSWNPPTGETTGYLVKYFWDNGALNGTKLMKTQTDLEITELPSGSRITLSVIALANDSMSGDNVTVVCYTASRPIANLTLTSHTGEITAKWDYSEGDLCFTVKLHLGNKLIDTKSNIREKTVTFEGLKTAANYTVTVHSVSGNTISPAVQESIFTPPLPPTDVKLSDKSKTHLSFTFTPPVNTQTAKYLVTINSSFWGHQWTEVLDNKTTHTFGNLRSGTSYTVQVQTMAASRSDLSEPAVLTTSTDADKMEITLSMVCSSKQPLLCDDKQTRASVFNQLKNKFDGLLRNSVFWKLERMENPNTGK